MAIVVKKVKEALKYVPVSEVGTDKPFTVLIKPLDNKTLLILEDRIVKREGEVVSFSMGRYAFDVCKAAVLGWENITDDKNIPIEFTLGKDGIPTDTTIANMGIEIIQEVAGIITAISRDSDKISILFPDAK